MKKVLKFIFMVVVVIIISVILFGGGKKEDNTKTEKIDENFAEHYCQDAKLYGDTLESYSLIDVLKYNKVFIGVGGYDEDGYKVYQLTWNGKNKLTGNRASFTCHLSGKDQGHVKLHYLSIDNNTIHGLKDYQIYNKDGKPIK